MAAVAFRGTTYPIVLPKLRDPRLHLAATITSLQVLGQVAFHFRLSIAQILLCLGTVAVIEVAITAWKQHVLMWPASALLTGNGVAFVLRVPGTHHADWWSLNGSWIFVATAAGALLSKYVIAWKGEHVFNPSNIGLVVVFLALGRTRVEPLDFWWGPMSWWMALALVIIVSGGFAILRRLKLLRVALSFWAAFAVGIGVIALSGHAMTARWHLGPVHGFYFWWVLVTSPEVLVFLFFMITDPKTAPRDLRARVVYGVTLGLLGAALIAPTTTEFAAKVALLSSLAIVCVVKAIPVRLDRRLVIPAAAAGLAAFAAVAAFANSGMSHAAAQPLPKGQLPRIAIDPSPGVQSQLDRKTAEQIAYGLIAARPAHEGDTLHVHLVPGSEQSPPTAVAQLAGVTYNLHQTSSGAWALTAPARPQAPTVVAGPSARLTDIAATVGLDFTQGSFSSGVTNETKAMMGGGVCWLDYNGDGKLDLFAVNSYASADTARPTSQLFENIGTRFRNVTQQAHAGLAVQGDGCAAGDLNGDGRTDLVVSTTSNVIVLWNHGGSFTPATLPGPSGWYTGVAIADVNGDGRPDVFVAGYSDPNEPVPGSYAGFPTNLAGVRDLLFLNLGNDRFREVGVQAGLESAFFRHGLGAEFMDVNGDGRPDLYVANDEDPNELYVNVPWPGGAAADPAHLGFRFEERGAAEHVADPFAGMGIAFANRTLFVTNSRGEPSAVYARSAGSFADARAPVDRVLGTGFAGWGASWVDLANSGRASLLIAAGAIPVTNLRKNAQHLRVFTGGRISTGASVNGRGLAAADAFNDGRVEVAVNTIGGKLLLLQSQRARGHWIDVAFSRFVPGTVVTVNGVSRQVQAGSSYLSSEDPRVHFGLGRSTVVRRLAVRYPWGARTVLRNVRADRIVTVPVPALQPRPTTSERVQRGCVTDFGPGSAAHWWNEEADAVFTEGAADEPVQARGLYLAALAASRAYRAEPTDRARNEAISYASYRLLLELASHDQGVGFTFKQLAYAFANLCYSPLVVTTRGSAPAAVGNRIAAQLIAQSLRDGSNEALHYADPTYEPQNQPLIVEQAGSTVHDATFWQPLALAQVAPPGAGAVPSQVQRFVGSQWGRVPTYASKPAVPAPALGDPSGATYKDEALAVIRATANRSGTISVDPSPVELNHFVPSHGLRADVQLDLALNGALNDAAVSVFGAKRKYQTPRPIEMIRYLAFNDELPIVPGLTRRSGNRIEVRLQGRWVRGDRWTPPALTPASPGYPSADAAFSTVAAVVLGQRVPDTGVSQGIELPMDVAAGRAVSRAVAR